jgi:predicted 3-demethylubiquinone-9 3-methyltransferase (glyoxalase superfamily)
MRVRTYSPSLTSVGQPVADSKGAPVASLAHKITPMLWFDDQAEYAAEFYVSVFPDSTIGAVSRYGEAGPGPAGSAMTVSFVLAGQPFTALNGGPLYTFSESISFVVDCDTQEEVDYYWDRLGHDGDPTAQQCGWLKDKYGLSWQVVPKALAIYMGDPDPVKAQRTVAAMLQMKKLDIEALRRAHDGIDAG